MHFLTSLKLRGVSLDPSRIAAQVVSGIGFIGAGAILTKHKIIDGLTTATGLWVAAGVGLTIGAGDVSSRSSCHELCFIDTSYYFASGSA
nr:MgtC/SapB family protein [Liquorilactobacillus satsumensis]